MIAGLLSLLLAAAAPAGEGRETRTLPPGSASPAADISALSWLAGSWAGPGVEGAPALEVYSAPSAGQMSGHFEQHRPDGGILFYELLQIAPRNGSLVYRVKHFDADLKGWEEKDAAEEFPLVAITPDTAHFDGLSFYRQGADAIRVVVAVHGRNGQVREMRFDYHRVRP